jgi:hypothetical protein
MPIYRVFSSAARSSCAFIFLRIVKAVIQTARPFMCKAAGLYQCIQPVLFRLRCRLTALFEERSKLGVLVGAALVIQQGGVHAPRVDRVPVDNGMVMDGGMIAPEAQRLGVVSSIHDVLVIEALPVQIVEGREMHNRLLRPGLAAALPLLRAAATPLKRAFDLIDAQLGASIQQARLAP